MALGTKRLLLALSLLALAAAPALADLKSDSDWYASMLWQGNVFTVIPPTTHSQHYEANGRAWARLGFDYAKDTETVGGNPVLVDRRPQTGPDFLGVSAKVGVYPQSLSDGTQTWTNPKAHYEIVDQNQHVLYEGDGAGQKAMKLEVGLSVTGVPVGTTTPKPSVTFTLLGWDQITNKPAAWPAASKTYTLTSKADGAPLRTDNTPRLPWLIYDAKTWVTKRTDPDTNAVTYYLYISLKENFADILGDGSNTNDNAASAGWSHIDVTDVVNGTPGSTEGFWTGSDGQPHPFMLAVVTDPVDHVYNVRYTGQLTYNVWDVSGTSPLLLATQTYSNQSMTWAYWTKSGLFTGTDTTVPVPPVDLANEHVLSNTCVQWQMRPRLRPMFVELKHEPQTERNSPRGIRYITMGQTISSPDWKSPWMATDQTSFDSTFAADANNFSLSPDGLTTVATPPAGTTWAIVTDAHQDSANGPILGARQRYTVDAWKEP